MCPVAVAALAVTESNADQESTFSTATWSDTPLRSKQSDPTFQEKVCLHKNQSFPLDHKTCAEEAIVVELSGLGEF